LGRRAWAFCNPDAGVTLGLLPLPVLGWVRGPPALWAESEPVAPGPVPWLICRSVRQGEATSEEKVSRR
jgi:hypothetical protein